MTEARTYVTIVSGLPRSGTSMMMQVLEAGGMAPLTDHVRTPDSDNPKGYYEFEPVKKTKEDPSWLTDAGGKVVKMVYRLLYDLPADHEYRVVFMRRDLTEVLASQKVMLERLGKDGAALSAERMEALFRRQIGEFEQWVAGQPCFAVLDVGYKDMIDRPAAQAQRLDAFLGGGLDVEAMAAVVDPSLYRQRKST